MVIPSPYMPKTGTSCVGFKKLYTGKMNSFFFGMKKSERRDEMDDEG
jgi:hypothetical protein